jgi:putative ABC transport system permease protein
VGLTSWGLAPVKRGRLHLSAVFALYIIRVRRRWMQDLLAVLGIAAGVALLYATQVASTSLSQPVRALNEGLVGHSQLQLISRGTAGFSEDMYNRVIALPGVVRAAPALQLPGNLVVGDHQIGVTLFGADPRIVKLRGNLLRGFSSQEAAEQETIVIPDPTARAIRIGTGDDVRVQLAGRTVTQPVVVADREQIGALVNTTIALAPLAYLQRLAHVGDRITRVLVEARPGQVGAVRDELARLAPGRSDVRPADYETTLFDQSIKPTTQASTVFAVLSALVGWLFAVCALFVTAADRRKLAVQQRNQGYPPTTTLATLLVDAIAIGVAGTLLGLAAGEVISRQGFSADVGFLSGAFPIGDERVVTWQSIAIASAGGMLAATFGVLAPVREFILTGRPRDARPAPAQEAPSGRPALWALLPGLGLACVVAAIVITMAAPGAAIAGLVVLTAGIVLLLPAILAATIGVIEWLNNRHGTVASVELALQQLRARRWRSRTLAIIATGAVAVFGATALEGARANLKAGLTGVVDGLSSVAPVWVAPRGAGDVYGTAAFTPADAARIEALPAVGRVERYRAGLLDVADRRAWVLGLPTAEAPLIPPHQVLEGNAALASARIGRDRGWATVSRALADDLGLHVGDRFTLPTPSLARLRLAAITTNLGWSAGAVLMNAQDFADAWGSDAVAAYHVHPAAGATAEDARREVESMLGPRSAFRAETAPERAQRQLTAGLSGLRRLQQIAQLTLLAAVLAMTAAMTGLLWQHRAFVGSLKVHGPRTGLIWRSLLVETCILFATGTLVGGVFGLFGQILATRGVQAVTGFPVVEGVQLGTAAWAIGLVAGVSLLSVVVPGYLVSRARPAWRD